MDTAVRFLENPKVQGTSEQNKRSFLAKKGLTEQVELKIRFYTQKMKHNLFNLFFYGFLQLYFCLILSQISQFIRILKVSVRHSNLIERTFHRERTINQIWKLENSFLSIKLLSMKMLCYL